VHALYGLGLVLQDIQAALIVSNRFLIGKLPYGLLAGLLQVADCLGIQRSIDMAGLLKMVGQLSRSGFQFIRIEGFHRLANLAMHMAATEARQALINQLPGFYGA
jgi:hypothetical protein